MEAKYRLGKREANYRTRCHEASPASGDGLRQPPKVEAAFGQMNRHYGKRLKSAACPLLRGNLFNQVTRAVPIDRCAARPARTPYNQRRCRQTAQTMRSWQQTEESEEISVRPRRRPTARTARHTQFPCRPDYASQRVSAPRSGRHSPAKGLAHHVVEPHGHKPHHLWLVLAHNHGLPPQVRPASEGAHA